MMTETRFLELLSKKFEVELSLHERKELLDYVQQRPEYESLIKEIEHFYQTPIYAQSVAEEQSLNRSRNLLWSGIQEEEQQEQVLDLSPKKSSFSWMKMVSAAAAAAAVFFFINYFLNKATTTQDTKENVVFTKKGSKTNLILPDGSQVWLNADSKISYSAGFSRESRELTLIGEAFFDVIKDPAHPFIIRTKELDIKVLGTSFNVRAYPEEAVTEATLISGVVEATLKGYDGKKVMLKPLEKITIAHTPGKENQQQLLQMRDTSFFTLTRVTKEPDSTTAETHWLKNKLVFEKMRLGEIAEQLGRIYDMDIQITDDKLKNKEYSGSYKDKTLQEILESLRLAGGFQYFIENKAVMIVPK